MGLFIKRDKDDTRHWTQVVEDVDRDLANKLTGGRRCSLVCGDAECRETGCLNTDGGSR